MTIFILWLDSIKEAVHLGYSRKGERMCELLGYRSSPTYPATIWTQSLGRHCPATTWTQSLGGLLTWQFGLPPHELNRWEDWWHELLSCHPRTQPMGGRSTYHHENSIPGRSICHSLERSCHRTTPHWPSIENVCNHDRKCRPILTHPVPFPPHTVPGSLLHLQNRAHNTNKNELDH